MELLVLDHQSRLLLRLIQLLKLKKFQVRSGLCAGETSEAISFATLNTDGTTSYSWTNDNTTIGLSASGAEIFLPLPFLIHLIMQLFQILQLLQLTQITELGQM